MVQRPTPYIHIRCISYDACTPYIQYTMHGTRCAVYMGKRSKHISWQLSRMSKLNFHPETAGPGGADSRSDVPCVWNTKPTIWVTTCIKICSCQLETRESKRCFALVSVLAGYRCAGIHSDVLCIWDNGLHLPAGSFRLYGIMVYACQLAAFDYMG